MVPVGLWGRDSEKNYVKAPLFLCCIVYHQQKPHKLLLMWKPPLTKEENAAHSGNNDNEKFSTKCEHSYISTPFHSTVFICDRNEKTNI